MTTFKQKPNAYLFDAVAWEGFIYDYNRYNDGDLKYPWSRVRDGLVAVIESARPVFPLNDELIKAGEDDMTTHKQAAQRLIDALRQQFCEDDFGQSVREAFAAMREALEQPESEKGCAECGKLPSDGWALYCVKCSEPMRKWTGLTDEKIKELYGDDDRLLRRVSGCQTTRPAGSPL